MVVSPSASVVVASQDNSVCVVGDVGEIDSVVMVGEVFCTVTVVVALSDALSE